MIETPLDNASQIQCGEFIQGESKHYQAQASKTDANRLIDLWRLADKLLKQKNDKSWTNSLLNRADKEIEALNRIYQEAVNQAIYWADQIQWLQKRFPEGTYRDVVGLCKVADREEYVEEQDYSLNPGRYVGVEIEDDDISAEEFKEQIRHNLLQLNELNSRSIELISKIEEGMKNIF